MTIIALTFPQESHSYYCITNLLLSSLLSAATSNNTLSIIAHSEGHKASTFSLSIKTASPC